MKSGGGVGGGGNLGSFQPMFQDLCSTGKTNKNSFDLNIRLKSMVVNCSNRAPSNIFFSI